MTTAQARQQWIAWWRAVAHRPSCPNPLSEEEIANIINEPDLPMIDLSHQFTYTHPCEGSFYPYEHYDD